MMTRECSQPSAPSAPSRLSARHLTPACRRPAGADDGRAPTPPADACASTDCAPADSPKAALLRRCLGPERSDEDWSRLHERFGQAIRDIAGGALLTAGFEARLDAVEDLCQEVFLRWWRAEARFDGFTDAAFWSFLQTSVRHTLCDHLRYLGARRRRPRGRPAIYGRPIGPHERLMRQERRRIVLRHCLEAGLGFEERRPHGAQPHDRPRRGRGSEPASATDEQGWRRALALGWVVLGGCTSREAGRRAGVEPKRVDQLVRRLRSNMSKEGISLPHRGSV